VQLDLVMGILLLAWSMLAPPGASQASLLLGQPVQLRQPNSARFEFAAQARAGRETLAVQGAGAFVRPDRAAVTLEMMDARVELVGIGQTVYFRGPGETEWSAADRDEAADQLGAARPPFDLGSAELGQAEAEALFFQLFGNHQQVGSETLRGVPTEHYRASLDLEALGALFGEAEAGPAGDLAGLSLSLNYWVGQRDRYLQRLTLNLSAPLGPAGPFGADSLELELRLDLRDFDQAIEIAAPLPAPASGPAPPAPAPVQAPVQLPGRGRAGS
jgi:hypothetical protein